jgi:NADPH:quinone reductase-like Zn-dependent oxidoreductase
MASSNIPTTMRALALSKHCTPKDYLIATLPVPRIQSEDEILVKVKAASINPIDVKMASEYVFFLVPF